MDDNGCCIVLYASNRIDCYLCKCNKKHEFAAIFFWCMKILQFFSFNPLPPFNHLYSYQRSIGSKINTFLPCKIKTGRFLFHRSETNSFDTWVQTMIFINYKFDFETLVAVIIKSYCRLKIEFSFLLRSMSLFFAKKQKARTIIYVDQSRNSYSSWRFARVILAYENSFGFAAKCLNSPLFQPKIAWWNKINSFSASTLFFSHDGDRQNNRTTWQSIFLPG